MGYAVLVACTYFGFPIAALVPVVLGMPSRSISVVYRALMAAGVWWYAWWVSRKRPAALAVPVQWVLGLLVIMLLARLAWHSFYAPLPLDLPWENLWAEVLVVVLVPALPFLAVPDREALAMGRRLCRWAGSSPSSRQSLVRCTRCANFHCQAVWRPTS